MDRVKLRITILGVDNAVSFDVLNDGIVKTGEFWTACATDTNRSMNAHISTTRTMPQFLSYIEEEAHGSLYWMNAASQPLGDEIREFILTGASSTGGAGGTGNAETDAKSTVEIYLSLLDEIIANLPSINTIEKAKEVATRISSMRAPFVTAVKGAYPTNGMGQWLQVGDWQEKTAKIQKLLNRNYPDVVTVIDKDLENMGGAFFSFRWNEFPLIWELYKEQQSKKVMSFNPFDLFTMTAYAAPSDVGTAAPTEQTGGGDTVLTNKGVLSKIIDMDIDGTFVFQLDGAATQKVDADSGKGLYPSDIVVEKGYNLLVEATIQGQPQEYKGNWTNYPSLVYGTAHNWAQFLQTPGWKNVYGGDSVGNSTKYINQYVTNGLVTVADWITLSGKQVLLAPTHGGKYPNSEMIAKYTTGYGCHLYTAVDLQLGNNMLSTGGSRQGDGEDFVINRFFRQKNKNGSYKYTKFDTSSHKLESESRSVNIASSAEEGSTLVEWGTSESEKFIPDITKPASEYKWEDVARKNTGVEKGTASRILEITESETPRRGSLLLSLFG